MNKPETIDWLFSNYAMMSCGLGGVLKDPPKSEVIIASLKSIAEQGLPEIKTIELGVAACIVTVDQDQYDRLAHFMLDIIQMSDWEELLVHAYMDRKDLSRTESEEVVRQIMESLEIGAWAPRILILVKESILSDNKRISLGEVSLN